MILLTIITSLHYSLSSHLACNVKDLATWHESAKNWYVIIDNKIMYALPLNRKSVPHTFSIIIGLLKIPQSKNQQIILQIRAA